MKFRGCKFAILLVIPLVLCQDSPPRLRDQFERVAKLIRAFPPEADYIPGSRHLVPPGLSEYLALMKADHPLASLLLLLRDPEPKVRTLAAAALVAKGDPRLLRNLGPLLEDHAASFDAITGLNASLNFPPSYGPATVASLVGMLAGRSSKTEFDQYWASHGVREYCADWTLWQFTHGFVDLAREQLLRVPSPDRELITLWIGKRQELLPYKGFSDQELLGAAMRLGRERILAVLHNQPPTTDPQLAPHLYRNGWNPHYRGMVLFLLDHAKELLLPSDAEVLLRFEKEERNRKDEYAYGARWPIAVASLLPLRATELLDEAAQRYPESPEVPMARWRMSGNLALPAIQRWFYGSDAAQGRLIHSITLAESKDQYKPLVRALLGSPDRRRINGDVMYYIALLMSEWHERSDVVFVDAIFALPPDPNPYGIGSRGLLVRAARVSRELVLDPRFLTADRELLYSIEQDLAGTLNLSRPQSMRLDELILHPDRQNPQGTPDAVSQEIRQLLRQAVSGPASP